MRYFLRGFDQTAPSGSFRIYLLSGRLKKASGESFSASTVSMIRYFAGTAVQPEKLTDCGEPADFDAFWANQKKRLAQVPFEGKVDRKLVKSLKNVNIYAVSIPAPGPRPATGYLYEMKSMDEVLAAVKTQFAFFCKWQCSCINAWESMSSFHNPLPLLSATLEGCMDNGKDCQAGGAKYNSTGNSCIGLGNVADSLNVIDYVCFKEKINLRKAAAIALILVGVVVFFWE